MIESEGYHALFGRTQGYYGPYIWRETVPMVYRVELPDETADLSGIQTRALELLRAHAKEMEEKYR